MKNVMTNAIKLFMRDKGFISMLTVIPIVLFLLMTVLLPYSENHSIAIINRTDNTIIEDSIKDIEGIKIQDVDEDEVASAIVGGNIDLAVIIAEDSESGSLNAQVVSAGETEISGAIELAISKASNGENEKMFSTNEVKKKTNNLKNTSAFMLFKFIQGGNLLGGFFIMERKRRMKDRVMLSGIKSGTYIGGVSFVYLIGTFIGSFVYFMAALLLNFDFGMKNSLDYLLMVCLANILAVGIYVFASSFANSVETLETMTTIVLMPMAFFAGILIPFDYMPKAFQLIGSCCPQRWISHGLEQIQKTGSLSSAALDIGLILGLSLILYVVGVYRNGKKLC